LKKNFLSLNPTADTQNSTALEKIYLYSSTTLLFDKIYCITKTDMKKANNIFFYKTFTLFNKFHIIYYTKDTEKEKTYLLFGRRSRLCQKTEVVVVSVLVMTAAGL
jgi:hypothetical protein